MAKQLIADLYGCDPKILDNELAIKEIAKEVVDEIGANIIEECVKKFEPIGITYFAVISTSHFSIHTWPEYGYAAVDVFSCSDIVVDKIVNKLEECLKSENIKTNLIERSVGYR